MALHCIESYSSVGIDLLRPRRLWQTLGLGCERRTALLHGLVTINRAIIFGPSLSPRYCAESIALEAALAMMRLRQQEAEQSPVEADQKKAKKKPAGGLHMLLLSALKCELSDCMCKPYRFPGARL